MPCSLLLVWAARGTRGAHLRQRAVWHQGGRDVPQGDVVDHGGAVLARQVELRCNRCNRWPTTQPQACREEPRRARHTLEMSPRRSPGATACTRQKGAPGGRRGRTCRRRPAGTRRGRAADQGTKGWTSDKQKCKSPQGAHCPSSTAHCSVPAAAASHAVDVVPGPVVAQSAAHLGLGRGLAGACGRAHHRTTRTGRREGSATETARDEWAAGAGGGRAAGTDAAHGEQPAGVLRGGRWRSPPVYFAGGGGGGRCGRGGGAGGNLTPALHLLQVRRQK